MLRKIVRVKCSGNIYCTILVLHIHGRIIHRRDKAAEFCRDKI